MVKQTELCHQIAKNQGFDTRIGRLDVSTHPFTSLIHAEHVRMTTRYTAGKLREGIVCTVHEGGHSLYEQGQSPEYVDLHVSLALSCGIHDSQSLLWYVALCSLVINCIIDMTYLLVEVTEDRLGYLQDTHWAIGLIGYFPTYTLGSIYAVQIFAAAKEAIPNLDGHLAKGEFHLLEMWLNENVHNQGSLCESGNRSDFQFDWQAFGQFALCEIFDGEVQ